MRLEDQPIWAAADAFGSLCVVRLCTAFGGDDVLLEGKSRLKPSNKFFYDESKWY